MVRAPRSVHRVTVHEHPIPVEPLHGSQHRRSTPAAAAASVQREQDRDQSAVHASLHSPAGRGKGLVRPSLSLEASEEQLLITTAPMTNSQMQLLLPGPPGSLLAGGGGANSAGITPCSSPDRALSALPQLSLEMPPPPKLRRTSADGEAGGPGGSNVLASAVLHPSLAGGGTFMFGAGFGGGYGYGVPNPLLLPGLALHQQVQASQMAAQAAAVGTIPATPANTSAAALPALFAPSPTALGSYRPPGLRLPTLTVDNLLPDWMALLGPQ